MLTPLNQVIDQYGSFLQLRDKLTALSNSSPVAATILIFIMVFIGVNILVTQTIELRRKFFGEWMHNALAWIGLAIGALIAALTSAGLVVDMRRASAPVPILVVDTDTVIGRPLLLSWKYDYPEESSVHFEVQGATDRYFRNVLKMLYRSGRATLVGSVNKKLFWRVRAVDDGRLPVSNWSSPVLITQYDDSLSRIADTRAVNIYVSKAFNQGIFEYEADDGTLKGFDLAVVRHIVSELADRLHIMAPITPNTLYVDWQELLGAPKSGHADIIISAISARPEREDKYSIKFSRPYYCTTQSILFRSAPLTRPIPTVIENKRIGVVTKTTSEDMLRKFPGKFSVRPYDEGDRMIADLAKGELDFALIDTPMARAAELQYGAHKLNFRELVADADVPAALSREMRQDRYAVAVRAGEPKLIEAIDGIIEDMRKGMLQKYLEQATEEFYKVKSPQNGPIDPRPDPSECRSG